MVELHPGLEELRRTLDVLEEEDSTVGLPLARDRAVGIARHLLARVEELEAMAGLGSSPRAVTTSEQASVHPLTTRPRAARDGS
jgi:hypothetical protein